MKLSFKRITSSGNFIPEIDGLRFIAIVSVVLFHLSGFLVVKDLNQYVDAIDYSTLKKWLSHGHLGVPLFFVISGFILGIPFAKYYINQEGSINLKKYFSRRLFRLEPPYILVMTILLFGAVYVAKTISLHNGILSYLSSIIYSHNFIYPEALPFLNGPAWSLEVEVQFYILAPLMAYFFLLKKPLMRRLLMIFCCIFFVFINHTYIHTYIHTVTLVNYIQYFLLGFLLADLYTQNSIIFQKTRFDTIIGLSLFLTLWLFQKDDFDSNLHRFGWELIQLTAIFFLYYYVIFHRIFRFLSFNLITNIGGMCYSIYLLHYPVISLVGNQLLKMDFSKYSFVATSIYSIFLILAVMIVSSLFFLLIERPCMNRDWNRKVIQFIAVAYHRLRYGRNPLPAEEQRS